MDLQHNAQIDVTGYQAEYADRLDQRLAADRKGQLKQTEVRFAAVDKDQDGRISLAEYQASGHSAFRFIDSNKDGLISKADPAPERRGRNASEQPQRRPALVMPTTHSVSGMLAMYDTDNNGEVSATEYQQIRQQAFARTDVDHNGDLSPAEYMQEFTDRLDQQIAKTRSAQLKQAEVRFKALDKDENGILSATEYHQSGARMFSRWDTDQNRLVDTAEVLPAAEPAATPVKDNKAKAATRTAP
jgi:Ca2+-binding EF-hand superfamily protein